MTAERPSAAGCWPSASQLLLLKAAALGPAESALAWREWLDSNDIERLDEGSTRLLPAVDFNLRQQGIANPHAAVMAGLRRHALFRNQWLLRGAAQVNAMLEQKQIPVLMLKGAAICCLDAPSVSVRPMNDVDLLVPRADAVRAMDTLLEHGFVSQARRPKELIFVRHSTPFTRERTEIDLHWDVLSERHSLSTGWPFQGARAFELAGRPALAPDATDRLFHAIVHGLRYSDTAACWWPLDALYVLRGPEPVDFERLIAVAVGHDVTRVLYDGLAYLRRELQVAVSDEVLARLRSIRITITTRLETFVRMHRSELLGELPMHLLQYRRLSEGRPLSQRLQALPGHLAGVWQLDAPRALPLALAKKVVQRARSWRTSVPPSKRAR